MTIPSYTPELRRLRFSHDSGEKFSSRILSLRLQDDGFILKYKIDEYPSIRTDYSSSYTDFTVLVQSKGKQYNLPIPDCTGLFRIALH